MRGFGNAFTDAAALTFSNMSEGVQSMLLRQYWTQSDTFGAGIGISVGRVPIASSDFSLGPYSYDDVEGDTGTRKSGAEKTPVGDFLGFVNSSTFRRTPHAAWGAPYVKRCR